MARSREKAKGRRVSGTFTLLPHCVTDAGNWSLCSGTGIKLLLDIARQFTGNNNGDLCASISVLRKRGWRSESVLHHARMELIHYGFIELTRQGGMHRASLFALAWQPIDDCGGKLDTRRTVVASHAYRTPKPKYRRPRRHDLASPESGDLNAGIRTRRAAA
jgi:hypothetical protein